MIAACCWSAVGASGSGGAPGAAGEHGARHARTCRRARGPPRPRRARGSPRATAATSAQRPASGRTARGRCGTRPSPPARACPRASAGAPARRCAPWRSRASSRSRSAASSVPSLRHHQLVDQAQHAGVLLHRGLGVDRRHARRHEVGARLLEQPRQFLEARGDANAGAPAAARSRAPAGRTAPGRRAGCTRSGSHDQSRYASVGPDRVAQLVVEHRRVDLVGARQRPRDRCPRVRRAARAPRPRCARGPRRSGRRVRRRSDGRRATSRYTGE